MTERYRLPDLQRIMQRLRDPHTGCPWDRAQTFASIVPSTLEECYELAAAIEEQDFAHIQDELGDVLFQVIFYSQLATEEHHFDLDDVVDGLARKLLRRHPHVFPDGQPESVATDRVDVEHVKASWESIKQAERQDRRLHSALADVPLALPALPRAQKLGKRAATVGMDFSGVAAAREKLQEELQELDAAVQGDSIAAVEDELGDVLFSCVNLARHLKVDSEAALRRASAKFEQRFATMEAMLDAAGQTIADADAATLDNFWQRAKVQLSGD